MKDASTFVESFFSRQRLKKTFIDVSICKSNIKENTFYARPCRSGRVKSRELLRLLKKRCPFVDEAIMMQAFEEMSSLITELISEGKTVELFSLGNFSLSARGKVEVERCEVEALQDENANLASLEAKALDDITSGGYNLDVSRIIKTKPTFSLKFEASPLVKKALERMDVNVAIKKKRAPTISSITNVVPKSVSDAHEGFPTILRIKGEDLKVVSHLDVKKEGGQQGTGADLTRIRDVGIAKEVGIYIEESGSEGAQKLELHNIIKNTPKELIIILDEKLKERQTYKLTIATQYSRTSSKGLGRLFKASKVKFTANDLKEKAPASQKIVPMTLLRKAFVNNLRPIDSRLINSYFERWQKYARG